MVASTGVVGLESPLMANLRALLVMLRVNGHWGRLVASPGAWVGVSRVWPVGLGVGGGGNFWWGGECSRGGGGGRCGAYLRGGKDCERKKCELKAALFGNSLANICIPYL